MIAILAVVAGVLALPQVQTPPAAPAPAVASGPELPELVVSADDTVIDHSCRVRIAPGKVLADFNGNGVIHIAASGIVVEFEPGSVLTGAAFPIQPDAYAGIGIRINGQKNVVIRGAKVRGYKCGILAAGADGVIVEDGEITDMYRQRLKSSTEAEDQSDWLWPHENDGREWVTRYGAAICIENGEHATVRRCKVRGSQNGLILDRVRDSGVYDNDFSFLSGWGLAMWRSGGNLVSRNAMDFCIRGYSHGVYNRGQDSAGILLFEQCGGNIIAENSATHSGDGFFGFAGKEALGEKAAPAAGFDYSKRGCNGNLLIGNDFSYAAAHGIEMTFSFDNRFISNRLVENAICGVWGGYSQDTLIQGNTFEGNGAIGAGQGGGINIEHGAGNMVVNNTFKKNSVGVSLWCNDNPGLLATPWAKANHKGSVDNTIAFNSMEGDAMGVSLRTTTGTRLAGNTLKDVKTPTKADAQSAVIDQVEGIGDLWMAPSYTAMGESRPVGARADLAGRDKIVMTEWGPWDHVSPLVRLVDRGEEGDTYEVYGAKKVTIGAQSHRTKVTEQPAKPPAVFRCTIGGDSQSSHPYQVLMEIDGAKQIIKGTSVPTRWLLRVFPWTVDPRNDAEGWRAEGKGENAVRVTVPGQLKLRLGYEGPRSIAGWEKAADKLPGKDHYGMVAETTVRLARGKWRFVASSDDGVRVTVDADPTPKPHVHEVVIENWTHHGPTRDVGELVMPETGMASIVVEYFQIDGFAVLDLTLERVEEP